MALDDIPLFSMLRGRLGYLSERQRLVAENVANADTPGYSPHDLKPFAIARQTQGLPPVTPTMTSPMHMAGTAPKPPSIYKPQKTPNSETTLNGNSVVLEEEMMKMSQSRMDYDAAISFYQKSLGLIRLAARRPGQS